MAVPSTETTRPYHEYLQDDEHLANTLYALSKIHFNFAEEGRDTSLYTNSHPNIQKHVNLLDGIALLLVYDDTGDIVATGRAVEANGNHVIYWTKNGPEKPTAREQDYLACLQQSFKRLDLPTDTLEIIVPMCRKKIINRMKKLNAALERTAKAAREAGNPPADNPFEINTQTPEAERLRRYLIEKKVIPDVSLNKFLNTFANAIRKLGNNPNDKIAQLIEIAYQLSLNSQKLTLAQIPSCDAYHLRKVKKLGSYFQTCMAIWVQLSMEPPEKRKDFRIEQIPAADTPPVRHEKDTLQALNLWARHFDYPEIKRFANVTAQYDHAQAGNPGTQFTTTAQHCELTIGLWLWKRKQQLNLPGPIEVGCSKASCHYCSIYLKQFNNWERREKLSKHDPRINQIVTKGIHEKW
ncbi:MAG: hypothetical protein Q9166_005285 [cf. Caloplaca sp. 2 TL-2023]